MHIFFYESQDTVKRQGRDAGFFDRLEEYGCPLDLEANLEETEDRAVMISQGGESWGDCRATLLPCGAVVYILALHITSDKADRYVMDYRVTTKWDRGIWLLPPEERKLRPGRCSRRAKVTNDRSYSIPQTGLTYDFEEVLNHRKGKPSGCFGPGRFISGTILAFGHKPIPVGVRHPVVKVTLVDQFDECFSEEISVIVDRSWISDRKLKQPVVRGGAFEPLQEDVIFPRDQDSSNNRNCERHQRCAVERTEAAVRAGSRTMRES
jgi:hypothetical protein